MWWLNEPKTMSLRPSPVTSPMAGELNTAVRPSWLGGVRNVQRTEPSGLTTVTPPRLLGTSSEPDPTTTSLRPLPSRSPTAGEESTAPSALAGHPGSRLPAASYA